MQITHRTPQKQKIAAYKAASIRPRHTERVKPETPSEDELRRRMIALDGAKPTVFRELDKKTAAEIKRAAVLKHLTKPMTVKQLADVVGISRENLSRTLREMKSSGLVKSEVIRAPKVNPVNVWSLA